METTNADKPKSPKQANPQPKPKADNVVAVPNALKPDKNADVPKYGFSAASIADQHLKIPAPAFSPKPIVTPPEKE